MTTVACVGIAVMDLLFTVERLPHAGGKYYADSFHEVGGGVAANAAVAVARLGGTARYIGVVGDDALGDQILADLRSFGVDTAEVARAHRTASPVSAVIVDADGERIIVNHTPSQLFEDKDLTAAREVASTDAVLVDVRWPAGAAAALDAASARGIPGVFDYDRPMGSGGNSLLATASHVVFSRAALAAAAAHDDPAEGLLLTQRRTGAWLAVTVGEHGVYWLDGDTVRHLPAFEVDAVDTVGAGDVFHGAFALALAEGLDEVQALRFASAASAVKCTRPGGRAGTPNRAEVETLLQGVD